MSDTPRIYVACLAAYNNGHLHGRWIDADQDADSIREAIRAMLSESPIPNSEEWAIHDFEGFCGLKISEQASIEEVAQLSELLQEHGEAYAAYVDCVGEHYATADGFEDHYCGVFDSEIAYAEQLIDDGVLGEIPEALAPYIDVEKFANDLQIGGDITICDRAGQYYVFDNH